MLESIKEVHNDYSFLISKVKYAKDMSNIGGTAEEITKIFNQDLEYYMAKFHNTWKESQEPYLCPDKDIHPKLNKNYNDTQL